MKLLKNNPLALTVAALVALSCSANAALINGTIDIGAFGSHVVVDKTANTVDFVDDSAILLGNALVGNATGDFLPLVLSPVNYVDFTYSPLSLANPLWSLVAGGASFDLLSITSISEAGSGLILAGAGVIHMAGYDDTFGSWSFSADTASGVTGNFTFSSQTASNVPDGGATVMLLGVALSGVGFLRRKLVA